MRNVVLIGLLIFALALAVGWAGWIFFSTSDVELSVHGWIALGLSAVFGFGLTAGLTWLMFYSARKGYDDVDHEIPQSLNRARSRDSTPDRVDE